MTRESQIVTERWMFVGDDIEEFQKWLHAFRNHYQGRRITGYVLDLSRGEIFAILSLDSSISHDMHHDIALMICSPDDSAACYNFRLLITAICSPIIAPNRVSYSFDHQDYPKLLTLCQTFQGLCPRPLSS